jgi:hypothetical protein
VGVGVGLGVDVGVDVSAGVGDAWMGGVREAEARVLDAPRRMTKGRSSRRRDKDGSTETASGEPSAAVPTVGLPEISGVGVVRLETPWSGSAGDRPRQPARRKMLRPTPMPSSKTTAASLRLPARLSGTALTGDPGTLAGTRDG